jgi:hypothetical protein
VLGVLGAGVAELFCSLDPDGLSPDSLLRAFLRDSDG